MLKLLSISKKSQRVIVLLSLLFFFQPKIFSQGKFIPVNVSLFHPVSINQSEDTTLFSLSLLYTRIGAIKGVNLGLGASLIHNGMDGLQVNGGYTWIGEEFNGVNLTGGVNAHGNNVKGFEAAGLANLVFGDFYGLQVVGAYNFVLGNFTGSQIAIIFNITGGDVSFFQLGNANLTGGSLKGLQVGGVFNFVGKTMRGAQFGPANITSDMNGLQFGGGNFARVSRGLQIGLFNVVQRQEGVPLGLVNVAVENGSLEWITYGSNFSTINSGIKFNANKFYSIIDVGFKHVVSRDSKFITVGFHYGYNFSLSQRFKLCPDIGYVQIFEEETEKDKDRKLHFALQGRFIGEYEFSDMFRVYAGFGISRRFDVRENKTYKFGKLLILGGISLF